MILLSECQELAGIILSDDLVVSVSENCQGLLSDDPVVSVSRSGRDCVD